MSIIPKAMNLKFINPNTILKNSLRSKQKRTQKFVVSETGLVSNVKLHIRGDDRFTSSWYEHFLQLRKITS